MGSIDFGKIATIVIFIFIGVFFFGDKIMFWYKHKDDMQFSLSRIVYTRADFNVMQTVEQEAVLQEVASICINKHHVDKLSCSDTAYWLAHSLEDKGVEVDLAIDWMKPCSIACETGKFDEAVYIERNKVTDEPMEKSEGTKWIWEK